MPFVLRVCPEHEATSQASEVKETDSELTFVSFSYKILLVIKEMVLLFLPPKEE